MKQAVGISMTALCLALTCAGAAAPASAASVERAYYQSGGSACTGALPTYEGALRKRPKAIANEGTTGAFVTCSAIANELNPHKPKLVYAYFINRGSAAVNVSCTFVNGDEFYLSTATPQTISLNPMELTGMFFEPEEEQFLRYAANLSCNLPPGVELNFFGQVIDEEVGL